MQTANLSLRVELQNRAASAGWPSLHAWLVKIDPLAAARIHPHDSQRIQRALEVYLLTGQTMTAAQANSTFPLSNYRILQLILSPANRLDLHQRIAIRFQQMLALGLIDEVKQLYERKDLTPTLPAMRAVGYRQIWSYLAGQLNKEEMRDQAIAATRQLAKRQMTWLRRWPDARWINGEWPILFTMIKQFLADFK